MCGQKRKEGMKRRTGVRRVGGIESDEGGGIEGKRYVRNDLSGRVITQSLGRGLSGKSSPKKGTILSA